MPTTPEQTSAEEQLETIFERANDRLSVTTRITSDRLKLFLDCSRVPPPPDTEQKQQNRIQLEELEEALQGIPANVLNKDVLADIVRIVNEGRSIEKRRIAKGEAPLHGKDGRLVYLVKKFSAPSQQKNREDSDLRHIHAFDNVTAETQIARIYPPTEGQDGVDALGKPIKAEKGKPVKITVDKTIQIVKHPGPEVFEILVAKAEGYVDENQGKVSVLNELVIDGDVDFVTGSLDFIGSIRVNGNVMKGFSVIAKGNVKIDGDVEEAYVESLQGSVSIGGSVVGHFIPNEITLRDKSLKKLSTEPANIRAKTGIKLFRMQGGLAESDGDIEIAKEVMNCTIRTKQAIRAPKGQLLGGTFYVVQGVEAALIGSPGESNPRIHLCSDLESSSSYSALLQSITGHKQAADLIIMQLGPYAHDIQAIKKLPDLQRQKIVLLLEKLKQVQTGLHDLEQEQNNLRQQSKQKKQIRVNFLQRLFKGAEINAEGSNLEVDQDYGGPRSVVYIAETKEFRFTDLKQLESEEAVVNEVPSDAQGVNK